MCIGRIKRVLATCFGFGCLLFKMFITYALICTPFFIYLLDLFEVI
jgi:hypothetical protein